MEKEIRPKLPRVSFKIIDVLIIAISVTLIAAIGGVVYSGDASSSRVIIRSADKNWDYPIDADAEIHVQGPLGETIVRISNGRAAIIASPCSAKTCLAAGELQRNGQWAACLPNKVIVLVEGRGSHAVDASTY